MPSDNTKEVFFGNYCQLCKFCNLDEDEEPCDECLEIPFREDTHKPMYFEEKPTKRGTKQH